MLYFGARLGNLCGRALSPRSNKRGKVLARDNRIPAGRQAHFVLRTFLRISRANLNVISSLNLVLLDYAHLQLPELFFSLSRVMHLVVASFFFPLFFEP